MGGVAWTEEEDQLLKKCVEQFGEGKWHRIPLLAGLNRCRKSCRLRWLNYLRPNIRRGSFTEEEVNLIIGLHKLVGNKWSFIAGRLPGRTANDVKNYWNCHLSKKLTNQDDADQVSKSDIEPKLGNLAASTTLPSSSTTAATTTLCHWENQEETASSLAVVPSSDQKEDCEEDFSTKNRSLNEASSYMDHDWEMDYDFAEVKMSAANQDYCNNNLEFDDLIFDMDLWVDSV